ncbi:hypothetical protein K3495_g17030, partial [Podosphaera aphanis]
MQPFEPPIYAGQKRTHSPPPPSTPHISHGIPLSQPQTSLQVYQEEPEISYDTPMLPFEPPTYAGNKRAHSPSPNSSPLPLTFTSHRGRTVQRHDYKRLNSGNAVITSEKYSDPKTRTEAMISKNASDWKIAAEAEIASLISTGTAIVIDQKD